MSLTVAPLLFVQVGDERLCLHGLARARAPSRVESDQIRELAGRPALKVDDEVLPFASMASMLGLAPERPPPEGELVLVLHGPRASRRRWRSTGCSRSGCRPSSRCEGMLSRFGHLSGATPLADGTPGDGALGRPPGRHARTAGELRLAALLRRARRRRSGAASWWSTTRPSPAS